MSAMPIRLLAVFCLVVTLAAPAAAQDALTVFAAASMRNALDVVNAAFTRATGIRVTTSYAASSALARQIAQGAPADAFISANVKWMEFLQEQKLVAPGSRVDLLGNALVLIVPKGSKLGKVDIVQGLDIAGLAGDGRIAIANTKGVPAGLYARAALQSLGAWLTAEPKLAQSENVRATLAYVARQEAPLGIVYATDAKVEPKVKIIGVFPAASHPPITYPVAAIAGREGKVASRYLHFLQTFAAKTIFEGYGFSFLVQPKAS
jgi:molybdate transport system substrate-binding protein